MAGLGERIEALGINTDVALAGGRINGREFNPLLAIALKNEPGNRTLDITLRMAGLRERTREQDIIGCAALASGRIRRLGFKLMLATAKKREPGKVIVGNTTELAGLCGRIV